MSTKSTISKEAEVEPLDETVADENIIEVERGYENPLVSLSDEENLPAVSNPALHRYLQEISQYELLSREETDELAVRFKEEGDQDAAYRLVSSNLRLVVKVAMDFQKYWMQNFMDLIQEGNVGLVQATKKFDPYRGVKFSYYAAYWIRAYVLKFIMDNWRLVKIGTTQAQRKLFFSLNKEKKLLEGQGFKPELTGMSPLKVRFVQILMTNRKIFFQVMVPVLNPPWRADKSRSNSLNYLTF